MVFGIGVATVYHVFHDVIKKLDRLLQFTNLQQSGEALHEIARKFKLSRSQPSLLDGCVGALDGICIKMAKPDKECNPAFFYSLKGYYATPVQAVCDSDYVFRYTSGLCGGATHDALENAVSGFMEEVESGLLRIVFWVVGDEAYSISEWIITPYPGSTLTHDEDSFDFFLSSLRMHIEQAFRVLLARSRIIRDGLNFSVK